MIFVCSALLSTTSVAYLGHNNAWISDFFSGPDPGNGLGGVYFSWTVECGPTIFLLSSSTPLLLQTKFMFSRQIRFGIDQSWRHEFFLRFDILLKSFQKMPKRFFYSRHPLHFFHKQNSCFQDRSALVPTSTENTSFSSIQYFVTKCPKDVVGEDDASHNLYL